MIQTGRSYFIECKYISSNNLIIFLKNWLGKVGCSGKYAIQSSEVKHWKKTSTEVAIITKLNNCYPHRNGWTNRMAFFLQLACSFRKKYHPIELQYPMHITQNECAKRKALFLFLPVCHLMLLDINVTAVVSKLC